MLREGNDKILTKMKHSPKDNGKANGPVCSGGDRE